MIRPTRQLTWREAGAVLMQPLAVRRFNKERGYASQLLTLYCYGFGPQGAETNNCTS